MFAFCFFCGINRTTDEHQHKYKGQNNEQAKKENEITFKDKAIKCIFIIFDGLLFSTGFISQLPLLSTASRWLGNSIRKYININGAFCFVVYTQFVFGGVMAIKL